MQKHAIILPLKENFSSENSGAVSIWVKSYIEFSKYKKNIFVFCNTIKGKPFFKKNVYYIKNTSNLLTNYSYIKNISELLIKKKFTSVEVHNRPEYARYLIKNTKIKVNLIFHNDPNHLRGSESDNKKFFLLKNCTNLFFVSHFLKKVFFKNLTVKHSNNCNVIYNAIKKIKKFPKKKNIIIFSGKLNSLKGYNIFGEAIIDILNRYPNWKAYVFGNEPREKFNFQHKNLFIKDWIGHGQLLKFYEKCSISVVNPTWEEPFGRTAMESASRGCAVITSISGGLQETFNNNLILKKNNKDHLISLLDKLIKNKKFLKKIQNQNFSHVVHDIQKKADQLDNYIPDFPLNTLLKNYRILQISNFGEKLDHRIFNLSISKKISNGLIRNGHDVINFDYRDYKNNFFENVDAKVLSIIKNYKPHLILLGHNNILQRETMLEIKNNYKSKIALWYEDALAVNGPDFKNSLKLIEKNNDLIDNYFITTHPDSVISKIKREKMYFIPIPVDKNIEYGHFYKAKKNKDLFFALSHGVNYGKLKRGLSDDRSIFIDKLIKLAGNSINFNILGLYNEQPKWNYDYDKELMRSKIALNLSRGKPAKYYSSNRIATLMGNGCPTAIDENVKLKDFFNNNEIIFYKNQLDLLKKTSKILKNSKLLKKIGKNGKIKYFKLFSNNFVAQYIIDKTFNLKNKYNYVWDR